MDQAVRAAAARVLVEVPEEAAVPVAQAQEEAGGQARVVQEHRAAVEVREEVAGPGAARAAEQRVALHPLSFNHLRPAPCRETKVRT